MRKLDLLLVAAIVLSPMNGLRFGKVGPAETLLLVWCVVALLGAKGRLKPGRLGPAWLVFYAVLLAGTLHGMIVTPNATLPSALATWAFLGGGCVVVYSVIRERTKLEAERVLSTVGVVSTLWFAALFLYGTVVSSTFLDAPLWYSTAMRFSGGADNPHQLAVLMAASVFINFRSCYVTTGLIRRVWYLGLGALALFLGYETSTTTFILAIAATTAVTLFYLILDRVPTRSGRLAVVVLAAMAVAGVTALQARHLVTLAQEFIDSDPNGQGRLTLWHSFGEVLDHVVVLGLGPGTYASGGQMEFHNSYIELAAMLGLPAAALALLVMGLGLRRLAKQWTLLAIMLPLFVYALPGFAFRRLTFWALFALCLAVAEILERRTGDTPSEPGRDGVTTPRRRSVEL